MIKANVLPSRNQWYIWSWYYHMHILGSNTIEYQLAVKKNYYHQLLAKEIDGEIASIVEF